MIGKVLFCLSAVAYSVLGPYANAIAAIKNVDIVVTHDTGPLLTTYTIQETSGKDQPAGWPFTHGMAFRRGDLPPGTHPEIRDAKTHLPLVYQWDEIATRTENGDDGSWRHAVFSVQLPAVAANGKYTIEFVRVNGSYYANGKHTLADLCAAHKLNIIFNNVANQDNSPRDSGTMTFDVCSNIGNVGRDAPQRVATGPVRDGWVVRGAPVYATTGDNDPLIYVRYYVDVYTDPSDQNSVGQVRHIANVANSWMNVKAGSAGNSGAPGPAGFANDPQMVIYSPVVRDGTTPIVDYDALFSETVADPTLPSNSVVAASTTSPGIGTKGVSIANPGTVSGIYYGTLITDTTNPGAIPAGCYIADPYVQASNYSLSCATGAGTRGNGVQAGDNLKFDTYFVQLNNPYSDPHSGDGQDGYFRSSKSVGTHLYYGGSCFQYSTLGTPPSGMTSGNIYYPYPTLYNQQSVAGDRFQLTTSPDLASLRPPYLVLPTTLGSGTQHLDYRICHRKFATWFTADPDGKSLWTGSPSSEPFEMTLDQDSSFQGQRLYWEQTGTVPPLNLSNANFWATQFPFDGVAIDWPYAIGTYYPLGITLAAGGSGGGQHSYIGIVAEWTARWWLSQNPAEIRNTRIFALDGEAFPFTSILNEVTGRLPTVNNGPPVGSDGGGGAPYAGMGALYPHLSAPGVAGSFSGVTEPLSGVPSGGDNPSVWWFGAWPTGIYNDHQSAFTSLTPQVFGDRHWFDAMRMQANRTATTTFDGLNGCCAETRPNRTFTFPSGSGTPPAGKTFYGVLYWGNTHAQGPRGGAWMARALASAAALGADGDIERQYFLDNVKENDNWWNAMKQHKDCAVPGTPQPGAWSNSPLAALNEIENQTFMGTYQIFSKYFLWTMLHDPLAWDQFNNSHLTALQSAFGTAGWPSSTPPIYGGSFIYNQWGDNQRSVYGKCRGLYVGDVTDYGIAEPNEVIDTSTGKIFVYLASPFDSGLTFTAGDKVKNFAIEPGVYTDSREDRATGDPVQDPVGSGAAEVPYNSWSCIVNFDNVNHVFQVSHPSPDCNHPGPAITSFTGFTGTSLCSPPPYYGTLPPGMDPAHSWRCSEVLAFRLQSPNFVPNPNYVFWGYNGASALVSAGVSAALPYYNQALTSGITLKDINGSNSAYDWDPAVVVP